jgi:DNA primase catalytic core
MARIPDEEITRIKQEVSLAQLVETAGISLKKHGKDLMGLCPFHDDKEPSLIITPDKNLWHCLGACNTGGSVIDWVMKIQGVSFRHAVELLQNNPSSLAADGAIKGAPVKHSTTPKLDNPLTAVEDAALLNQVIDFYHDALKQSPEALAYLDKRGLNHPELIDHFKLGLANRSLAYRLPAKNRKAGAEIRGQLQRIGILRESGHEHFNGSLVFPVINDNQVKEVYGRKLNDNLRKGTVFHLYLPGAHQGIFNIDALHASKEIILCESIIDALSFWVNGFRNVTCAYGVNGVTDELLTAFKQCNIQKLYIAYDRDEAGNKAADTLVAKLKECIDCYRVLFPKNMDANSYVVKMQPATKALQLVIDKAEYMGEGEPQHQTDKILQHVSKVTADNLNPLAAKENNNAQLDVSDDAVHLTLGDRCYRVRGNLDQSHEQLKINLMLKTDTGMHIDKLDLYSAKARQVFINQASIECACKDSILKKDLGQLLLQIETLQSEQQAEQTQENKTLSRDEQDNALSLLNDEHLLQRILDDFNRAGVIGEETNKLVGYLAAVSRKLSKPLAVMVQSSSAAGKSSLMDAILAMMPEEDKTQYSAMTGQSLFYMGESDLKNRILAISEEEGAHNASYALKLLQSEGEVSIASTGKDENTGELVTKEYRVEGPVMLFMTTTAIDIDEELLNRCLVLSVNETREQTQAIHQQQRQRRTLEGLIASQQTQAILKQHQDAQRLLKPLVVINPYANQLTFLDVKTRTRRDHEKYLTLIDSITLLHQYQREIKTVTVGDNTLEYIEASIEDIEVANKLAHEVLGRTLDELPPQTRKLLKHIQVMVKERCDKQAISQDDVRFSRKQIREYTGWGNTQIKVHCKRLEDMEYLLTHRGGRGQSFEYELLYDGDNQEEQSRLMGLIDVHQLKKSNQKHPYDANRSGVNQEVSGPSHPQVGRGAAPVKPPQVSPDTDESQTGRTNTNNTTHYNNAHDTPYPQVAIACAAES